MITKGGIAVFFSLFFLFGCTSSTGVPLENKPKHHLTTGFRNYPPLPTASSKGVLFYLRRVWGSFFFPDVPPEHNLSEDEALKLLKSLDGEETITWLGHASFLLRIGKKTILIDPFLTDRASPLSWAGPKRYVPPGISVENLPPIDIILVSHNHYDHLDAETVETIANKKHIQVVLPLGLKSFFIERGYQKVKELDWEEEILIDGISIHSLPAVHDSIRSTSDKNKTLWCSWSIVTPAKRVFFAGDTGYSETIFKKIGEQRGPFDLALLPIGAYEPRELMWMSHINPEEAVTIGLELTAKRLVAMHWGTINLSDEPPWEPPKRFVSAGLKAGFDQKNLWVMKIGETLAFTTDSDGL